eukprot:TRINITY_DN44363_c0_g1_i6.p1 TRINITY_DN44363_c0_g1~~TRINITY_DN44363_c0_g1_i6.p1  ORF type:complete len:782 (+),score=122.67 TRINITY_DN44363_c0_g1_i6:652-2997(+)
MAFTRGSVRRRTATGTRVLLAASPMPSSAVLPREDCCASAAATSSSEFEVRGQDLTQDAVAMAVLRALNACWTRMDLRVAGLLVAAKTYQVEPLASGFGLVEMIPETTSLAELKNGFSKGDTSLRVLDYLGGDRAKLARLACSTAGLLASNYLIGAAGGDGENLFVATDGSLFRTDFSFLFGGQPTVLGGAVQFDSPVVWLPKAVTTALGNLWPEVQQAALSAYRAGIQLLLPRPPASPLVHSAWAQAQAMLLFVEAGLGLQAVGYLSKLSEPEFREAVRVADCAFAKKLKTFLHEAFSFRSRPREKNCVLLCSGRQYRQEADNFENLLSRETTPISSQAVDVQGLAGCVSDACFAVDCETWCLGMRALALLLAEDSEEAGAGLLYHLLQQQFRGLLPRCREALSFHASAKCKEALRCFAALFAPAEKEVHAWVTMLQASGLDAAAARLATLTTATSPPSAEGEAFYSACEASGGALCALLRWDIAHSVRRRTNVAMRKFGTSSIKPEAQLIQRDAQVARMAAARCLLWMMAEALPLAASPSALRRQSHKESTAATGRGCYSCDDKDWRDLLEKLVSLVPDLRLVSVAIMSLPAQERQNAVPLLEKMAAPPASGDELDSYKALLPSPLEGFLSPVDGVKRSKSDSAQPAAPGESAALRLCRCAQECLQALAADPEPSVKRAAVLAISCAVDSDWARNFLKTSADGADSAPRIGALSMFNKLASSGSEDAQLSMSSTSCCGADSPVGARRRGYTVQGDACTDVSRPWQIPEDDPFLRRRSTA